MTWGRGRLGAGSGLGLFIWRYHFDDFSYTFTGFGRFFTQLRHQSLDQVTPQTQVGTMKLLFISVLLYFLRPSQILQNSHDLPTYIHTM